MLCEARHRTGVPPPMPKAAAPFGNFIFTGGAPELADIDA
jgi:hypothetical protein